MSGAPPTEKSRRKLTALEALTYLILSLVALGLIVNFESERNQALDHARLEQREKVYQEGRQATARIERYFDQIYRGLRTVARLPAVRSLDRFAHNFHVNARASVQEIYNNLAETVRVSEIYVVPLDFDPEAIDPVTGKPQEPIATFDELIVGRSADRKSSERLAHLDGGGTIDEVEIHEYRLMREQIAVLRAGYMDESAIKDLAYPAILGHEVITCDNSHYSLSSPNDEDRKGLVYSIPFYGLDGRMRGIISAVMLTSTIRQQLPPGQYVISNPIYDLRIGHPVASIRPLAVSARAVAVTAASPPAATNDFDLSLRDIKGGWVVSNAMSEASYEASASVIAAKEKATYGQIAILAAFSAALFIVHLTAQRQREMEARNALLEVRVRERTEALEFARHEAEAANLAKTRFLAHMSHEIRTPMSAVLGTVDLLINSRPGGLAEHHLSTIRNSGQALLDLINEVLDLSAVEAGRVTLSQAPDQPRVLIADVARLLEPKAAEKGLTIAIAVAPDVPEAIWIDGGRFRQVLINLVANAIHATEHGKVTVTADVEASENGVGRHVRFDVIDTGPGLTSHGNLFDLKRPAVQAGILRAGGGAGLGLSISRALVEEMGGQISQRNRPEGGAVFSFTHPLREAEIGTFAGLENETPLLHVLQGPVAKLDGRGILLVEDNATLAALAREILQTSGCDVTVRADGLSALAMLESQGFDLVLMDCRLHGMDGLEVARLIRGYEQQQQISPVPIVALTANAFDWDRDACLAAGMNDFLSKPYTAAQLIDIVQRNVGAIRGHQPP